MTNRPQANRRGGKRVPPGTRPRCSPPLFAGLLGALTLAIAGCRTPAPPRVEAPVFYPPDAGQARLQFLTGFTRPEQIVPPPSWLRRFLVGDAAAKRPLLKPYGLTLRNGAISVCDTVAAMVHRIEPAAGTWTYFQPQGPGQFKKIVNLDEDADGRRYIADAQRGQVLVFDRAGGYEGSLGAEGELKPTDVRLRGREAFVADLKSRRVRVYDRLTRSFLRQIPAGPVEKDQDLFAPTNLALGARGDVYVSDSGAFRVQRYAPNGAFVRSYGHQGDSPGSFARNKGVAVDREGRVYVVDAAFQNVQIFDDQGKLLLHFGDASVPGRGLLDLPAGVVIDYDHTALFADRVAPGQTVEYLVLVASQYGLDKVNVYGFLRRAP